MAELMSDAYTVRASAYSGLGFLVKAEADQRAARLAKTGLRQITKTGSWDWHCTTAGTALCKSRTDDQDGSDSDDSSEGPFRKPSSSDSDESDHMTSPPIVMPHNAAFDEGQQGGQHGKSCWSVREDFAVHIECMLGVAHLARLRLVNVSWNSVENAWSTDVVCTLLGPAQDPHKASTARLQQVPAMVRTLLGRPPPIVIDLGTGYTKAGFGGQSSPIIACPNFIVVIGRQIVTLGRLPVPSVLVPFLQSSVFSPLGVCPRLHPIILLCTTALRV